MAVSEIVGYRCQHCNEKWVATKLFNRKAVYEAPKCLENPLRFLVVTVWLCECGFCGKDNEVIYAEF